MQISSNTAPLNGAAIAKRPLPYWLRIAVAVALLLSLSQVIGFSDVLARIRNCPPRQTVLAFVLTLGMHGLAAYRLRLLAKSQGFPLPASEALLVHLSSAFYSLFVPGGTASGWAVRLVRLTRGTGRVAPALQLLAGDRALATASGLVVGIVAGALLAANAPVWIVLALLVLTMAATVVCLALFSGTASVLPLSWMRRIPMLGRAIGKLEARGALLRRPDASTVLKATGLSFAAHAFGVLAWLVLAQALKVPLDPMWVAWIRSAAVAATLMPATIGGLGVRESAVVYLASFAGIFAADAMAWSLLVFAATVLSVGVLGGLLEAYSFSRPSDQLDPSV